MPHERLPVSTAARVGARCDSNVIVVALSAEFSEGDGDRGRPVRSYHPLAVGTVGVV